MFETTKQWNAIEYLRLVSLYNKVSLVNVFNAKGIYKAENVLALD